jgi:hypothetical protein
MLAINLLFFIRCCDSLLRFVAAIRCDSYLLLRFVAIRLIVVSGSLLEGRDTLVTLKLIECHKKWSMLFVQLSVIARMAGRV